MDDFHFFKIKIVFTNDENVKKKYHCKYPTKNKIIVILKFGTRDQNHGM